ncbi:MAG TPA: DUF58 domain-containing protein [Steroidobacteraceae bacterium]|nr:DUF58 domain-containing protein [Steroidobacteraceae bacterium]
MRAVIPAVGKRIRARLAAWARRRQGDDRLPLTLERRRLYILPSRAGAAFGLLWVLMLLAALNYGNSLALLLTFLLAGFALVAMHECHRNLLGIALRAVEAPAVFAGSVGRVRLALENPATVPRPGLEAGLDDAADVSVDVAALGSGRLELPLPAERRGVVRIERLRLATSHPFGLFRAWTWVHLPVQMLVYPRPLGSLPMPAASGRRHGAGRPHGHLGLDEWLGLRPFRDGDSPRQVDWKAYARGAPLLVKEYSPTGADLCLFDFAALRSPDTEARLSQLARWVVDAEAGGECYGLVLPGTTVAPNRGPEHRHQCLVALALHGSDPHAAPRA